MIQSEYLKLTDLNKNYRQKKVLNPKILDVIFGIFLFIVFCYLLFCLVFIQAEVEGSSMQPTLNASGYKDIVYANRFYKGTNGNIILIETSEEILIKRLIATEGQKLTLKRNETDGFFYYYVDGVELEEDYISDFRTAMDDSYFLEKFCTITGIELVEPGEEAYYIIPKGKFFALGDNREVSKDSTYYGAFDNDRILGTIAFYHPASQTLWGYFWQRVCAIF